MEVSDNEDLIIFGAHWVREALKVFLDGHVLCVKPGQFPGPRVLTQSILQALGDSGSVFNSQLRLHSSIPVQYDAERQRNPACATTR